jgi:hypothetical protein
MAYSAIGKKPDEILKDFESHLLDADYEGNTTEYMQAAIAMAAARAQERWAKVAAVAACVSTAVAIAAVIVALR